MNAWLDKPDADGLWWRCDADGKNVSMCMVRGGEFWFVTNGSSLGIGLNFTIAVEPAKWQPCQKITTPEPYKWPKPPVVKQYTANLRGVSRFVTRVGNYVVSHFDSGEHAGCFDSWSQVEKTYTDIKPLEDT